MCVVGGKTQRKLVILAFTQVYYLKIKHLKTIFPSMYPELLSLISQKQQLTVAGQIFFSVFSYYKALNRIFVSRNI